MHRRDVIIDLVHENGWTEGAELGLWDGRTYLKVLSACPNLTLIGVDMWESQGYYIGTDAFGNVWDHKKHERKVKDGAVMFGDRAQVVKADTVVAAELVNNESLDFVFIDADHSTEGVTRDIKAWRTKLKPNGRLMGHDIDWKSVRDALEGLGLEYTILSDNVWIV